MHHETVYIGIGSNLGEPVPQAKQAIRDIAKIRQSELILTSSLYSSAALETGDQEEVQQDYINAIVGLKTSLTPFELLIELQSIEQAHYRIRDPDNKWGPRTMDLDIILFGNKHIHDSHLTIPHLEMQNRLFVLQPLMEITGEIYLPGLGSLQYLIQQAPKMQIQKFDSKVL